jgi:hypothetical protein
VQGEARELRQHKPAARKLLHRVLNPAILGLAKHNIAVLEARLWRVFFLSGLFLGHRVSFGLFARTGEPGIGLVRQVCLKNRRTASALQLSGVFFK